MMLQLASHLGGISAPRWLKLVWSARASDFCTKVHEYLERESTLTDIVICLILHIRIEKVDGDG